MKTKPFSSIPFFRRWYRFGWRSPVVLWKRNRASKWPFRLRMAWQRALRGHSDDQLWSLNYALAKLTVAGVQAMRRWAHGHPAELENWEEWDAILTRIESGFQAWIDEDGWFNDKLDAEKKFNDGMALYSKWFGALWD